MDEQLRRIYVTELVEQIKHLTGGQFETFGYRILEHLHPAFWSHRGTTSEGAPVGYTVDSAAKNATLVAEYSTERDYFAGSLEKLQGDIKHAREQHPHVEHLWLLSNREAGPLKRTEVDNLTVTCHGASPTIEVMDARQLAGFIVDSLDAESFIDALLSFLPFLDRMRTEWALSHRIPSYPGYVPRPNEEKALEDHLASHVITVVTGMSGAGKSALCGAVALRLRDRYDAAFWLDAAEITKVEQLMAVDVLSTGVRVNVLGLLKRRRCLIILDNVSATLRFDRFAKYFAPESRIIITSQFDSPEAIHLRDVDQNQARAILQGSCDKPCPDDVFHKVWNAVGGHPLVLAILSGEVKEADNEWGVAARYCEGASGLEDPEQRRRVCERILNGHRDTLRRELAFIRWCDSPRLDRNVLEAVCGPASELALSRRNFLAVDAPGIVRVHDLVFDSIKSLGVEVTAQTEAEFTQKLESYLTKTIREERSSLHRAARVHQPLLVRLLASRDPTFRYAYAIVRGRDTDLARLGDPLADAGHLSSVPYGARTDIEVRAIIEAIEARYTVTRLTKGTKDARRAVDPLLPAFDELMRIPSIPEELSRDIQHHRAKLLRFLGREAEAEAAFRSLVEAYPSFDAARVQLGRILAQKKGAGDELKLHFEAIVARADSAGEVVDTLYLSAFEMLRSKELKDYAIKAITARKDVLVRLIERTAAIGMSLPFSAVAALGLNMWYDAPDLFVELFHALPSRTADLEDDDQRFDWAQLQKLAAKALKMTDPVQSRALHLAARDAYESIDRPKPFQSVQYAEYLIRSDEPASALSALDRVDEAGREAHWYHRRAQALRSLGRFPEAIAAIDGALAHKGSRGYEARFHYDRFLIRQDSGDPNAVEDLRLARDRATSERDRAQYQKELALLEASEGKPAAG